MSYLASLSGKQRVWLAATLAAMAAIVVIGWALAPEVETPSVSAFSTDMSIREAALKLAVTRKAVARELGLALDVSRKKPLSALGVEQAELDKAAHHLLSHQDSRLKYHVFAALVLGGLVYLVRLGRPDGSPAAERRRWYPRVPYLAALVAAVSVCGFGLGKSPNPMEGVVKVFKSMVGLYASVGDKMIAVLFFIALAVVGNKLICGWACPFGALQELLYSLPILRRLKKRKLPFGLTNLVRGGMFAAMLLLLFGIVGGRRGFVVYHFINPFNLFNLDFEELSVVVTIVAAMVVAVVAYRPFCQLICPFGFVSWLAERLSLVRVRIDAEQCTECGACVRACPLEAAKDKVARKLFGADCFSCARCLNVCPHDAIAYRSVLATEPRRDRAPSALNAGRRTGADT